MSAELTVLTLAALLQGVQFVLYAVPANRELGPGYTMSARDREPSRAMSDRTARLGRALDNHFEGLILFGIAVGVVQMSAQNTAFTAACAWVYLIARLLYVPAYALGLRPHRSFIWIIGFAATMLMLLAALI
ncbi:MULTISPECIES: MAPEG family protein [Sulfitobacter]|uniref:MAPEG family protein n=1 Tax=Sulfitobacter TaxID=60136 RepID=UPI002307A841|nr:MULTISPECIES: MAPEG family protein [Sulfitobacter]MDF3383272.1 MAPEG family protein [Sulfitobacter sp. Ks11]MDF3386691.1 MAPEG family protein [Sulfitobacter sp. M85]MDF3390110.1 MAPEG family protein [Sulfitobacter sp. Ks16]MDF3400747.1 MAPEG family protein [Sulfitobacter sp. KE39]MDF3404168.1 MAPEG family protein [Sulfitobacter sp. Ks35]